MKRLISILLVLALCCSLAACASRDTKKSDEDEEEVEYTLEDVLIARAVEMARLTGLQAGTDYQAAMNMPEELIYVASVFTVSADSEPEEALISPVSDDIATEVTRLHGYLLGDTHLAVTSTLNHSTIMKLPEALEETTAVFLNYGADCSILVVFTPLDGKITGVATHPLYPDVSDRILDEYFSDADTLDEDAIEEACDRAEDVSCEASPGRETPTAQYYTDLALTVLDGVGNMDEEDAAEFTGDPAVIELAVFFAEGVSTEPAQVGVYTFADGGDAMFQTIDASDVLALRDPELTALARQQLFASLPNSFAGRYGVAAIAANSVIQAQAEPVILGSVPEGMDSAVLVMLTYPGIMTAMVCIYDSGYGLYQYSYSFLPDTPNWEEGTEEVGLEALE